MNTCKIKQEELINQIFNINVLLNIYNEKGVFTYFYTTLHAKFMKKIFCRNKKDVGMGG